MKKTVAALVISLIITIIPALVYADQQQVADAADTTQVADDSQVVVIVNPTPEQVLSADRQILAPDDSNEPENGDALSLSSEDTEDPAYSIDDKEMTFDMPVPLNERVEAYIHYFTNRIKERFSTWLTRSEMYLPMMKKTFKEKGLPEDLTYLALIESGFSTRAVSTANAVGQWQFIKGTGKRYGLRIDRWIDERRDPEKATAAAADYLTDLYGMFNDWHLAAAGYNAGEGKIIRAINKYDTNDFWQLSQPNYKYLRRETKEYVPKLIAATRIAKEPAKYGFDEIESPPSLVYETVTINGMKDLREIAVVAECSVEDLKLLNPELKTSFTPPNYPDYQLNVPVGKKAVIEGRMANLNTIQEKVALKEVGPEKRYTKKQRRGTSGRKTISYYVVRKGDTIHEIADRYNVPTSRLVKWNKLRGKQLKAGKKLKIYVERKSNKKYS